MGIGGEGDGGESGDLAWVSVVSSHRVRPVLASDPTSLHSHHLHGRVGRGCCSETPSRRHNSSHCRQWLPRP